VEQLTVQQRTALIAEIETAKFLLRDGLRAVLEVDPSNPSYRAPLFLVAQGLERLMKVAWCLTQLESGEPLPTSWSVRNLFGHDLVRLLGAMSEIASGPAYRDQSVAQRADADFLASDPFLRLFIRAVTAFGDGSRYEDLNAFLDPTYRRLADPDTEFAELETFVLDAHPNLRSRLTSPDLSKVYRTLNTDLVEAMKSEVVTTTQRLMRAVGRFFVWGPCGGLGQQFSAQIMEFVSRHDHELTELPRGWRRD